MRERNIVMLGGDLRQYYMAKSLVKRGFAISYYGILFPGEMPGVHHCNSKEEMWEKLQKEETILLLPLSCTRDGVYVKSNSLSDDNVLLEEIPQRVEMGQNVFGGGFPIWFYEKMQEKGAEITDFSRNDNVVTINLAATAEGAVVEAKLLSDKMILGSKSLVLGTGKLGKELENRLRQWGSDVIISEVWKADNWDFVFNTGWGIVLDARALNEMGPEPIIIDMAPLPGGIDYDYAKKQGITAKFSMELLGKYAARSMGEILADELTRAIRIL